MSRWVQSLRQCVGSLRQLSRSSQLYSNAQDLGTSMHKVNNLEKKFLVWTGKYKAVAEVPDLVAGEVVEKARNRMRIRVANVMMLCTLIACLVVSISGKKAHDRGESLQKRNLEWHQSQNKDTSLENKEGKEP